MGGQSGGASNLELFYNSKYLYLRKFYGPAHTRNIYRIDLIKARMKAVRYRLLAAVCPMRRLQAKKALYSSLSRQLRNMSPLEAAPPGGGR
jgi:hypothetical protein